MVFAFRGRIGLGPVSGMEVRIWNDSPIDRVMKDYAAGRLIFQDAVNALYGWADSPFQQHYMTYTKTTLSEMMVKHGFMIDSFSGSPGPEDRPWWLVFRGRKTARVSWREYGN